jgi:hypothetical protein
VSHAKSGTMLPRRTPVTLSAGDVYEKGKVKVRVRKVYQHGLSKRGIFTQETHTIIISQVSWVSGMFSLPPSVDLAGYMLM